MKLKAASRGMKSRVGRDAHSSTQISKEYGLSKIFQTSSAVALGQGIFFQLFCFQNDRNIQFFVMKELVY